MGTITTAQASRWDRAIGWLSVTGIAAVLASLFFTTVRYDAYSLGAYSIDASSVRLADSDPWPQLWAFVLAGLVGLAAVSLLVPGRSPRTGIAIVLGLGPAMLVTGLTWAALVARDEVSGRPGFVLMELGCVCIAAAACLAATRSRDVRLVIPRSLPTAWPTIAAVLIGILAALALGVRQLEASDLWGLIVSLTLLSAGICVLSAELQRRGIPGSVWFIAAGVLYAGAVTVFIQSQDPPTTSEGMYLARDAVLILGAVAVPFLSTVVLLRRQGAVLLAAWSVSLLAPRLSQLQEPMNAPAALATAVAAALLLAYHLHARSRSVDDAGGTLTEVRQAGGPCP